MRIDAVVVLSLAMCSSVGKRRELVKHKMKESALCPRCHHPEVDHSQRKLIVNENEPAILFTCKVRGCLCTWAILEELLKTEESVDHVAGDLQLPVGRDSRVKQKSVEEG